ncbi:MAG TPA: hypothetical protein VNT26_21950, partial [Candidatus Sulfotelmatobacter sp.]|nr:hypothetical protein [Candidatus Sulfotelmatobacter sp.]
MLAKARSAAINSIVLFALLLASTTLRAQSASGVTNQLLEATQRRTDALLARPALSAYRGWIKFLRFQAEREVAHAGATNNLSCTNVARFADWVGRIEANPDVLGTLRGIQEWAYESSADDSGQPFKLSIPTDYDPARPPGLLVILHANTANHLEHSGWMKPHPGMFELSVLGRARGAGYEGLAEADVLQAMDYVEQHWRIDTNRVHLTGGSMGAMGVFNLGADYPHLFASGQISYGILLARPLNNLLTLPIYALHSQDDWLAPIVTARAPLARLRQLGGQVIWEETNGFGHSFPDDGYQRAEAWRQRQVRPDPRQVRHLDFTALSGAAVRAWWAEITEWGPAARPAQFALTAGRDNTLYAELANITRLRLRLGESPFDRQQPLRVSVGGAVPFEVGAPLPESLVLVSGPQGWHAETNSTLPSFRLHTPGGPMLLYDGSPLLIVYGTSGDTNLCVAMRAAAEAASKSANPGWAYDGGPAGSDGVPHHQNLYGRLKVKPDREVTAADLQRCHLVLIGTAEQNSVVARLAPQLPVRWTEGKLTCSDGLELGGTNRVITLAHFNPLSPQRLIYWVASDQAQAYAGGGNMARPGADFVVADLAQSTLMVARSFDSQWRWEATRTASPLLPTHLIGKHALDIAAAKSLRRGTGADFVFAYISTNTAPMAVSGITRLADGLAFVYY